MIQQTKNHRQLLNAVILMAAILFMVGCSKKSPKQAEEALVKEVETKTAPVEVETVKIAEAVETLPTPIELPILKMPWRESLNKIVDRRRGWNPTLTNWYEKELPDFSITDIADNLHDISDYRGKNLMITLWATWCGPCKEEIPHLIALENIIKRDNLPMKILAISNESAQTVKDFVLRNKINYTVFSTPTSALPKPLTLAEFIPTTYFIDPQGKIKLIIQGTSYLGDLKAIMLAQ